MSVMSLTMIIGKTNQLYIEWFYYGVVNLNEDSGVRIFCFVFVEVATVKYHSVILSFTYVNCIMNVSYKILWNTTWKECWSVKGRNLNPRQTVTDSWLTLHRPLPTDDSCITDCYQQLICPSQTVTDRWLAHHRPLPTGDLPITDHYRQVTHPSQTVTDRWFHRHPPLQTDEDELKC